MHCPFCNAKDTKVADSRLNDDNNSIKRRRKCEKCEKRFTTFETIEIEMPLVVKTDGRREQYSQAKIYSGLSKATYKRPVHVVQLDRIVQNIENTLLSLNKKEVMARDIGQLVMENLRLLDPVAYVRFASVYKTFKDINEFVHDLKLEENNQNKPRSITRELQ